MSTEIRERIMKAVRQKKQITYKGKPIKITADFSMETLKARRAWCEVFQALNENTFKARIHYPAKQSFKIDGEIKNFIDKQKLKQYMTMKPPLQSILQGILHIEDEHKQNHEKVDSIKLQKKIQEIRVALVQLSDAHNQALKQKEPTNWQESSHTYQY
jgi:hypothetical protein